MHDTDHEGLDGEVSQPISQSSLVAAAPACRDGISVQPLLTCATLTGCQDEQPLRSVYLTVASDPPQPVWVYTSMACHRHMEEEFILAKMSHRLPSPFWSFHCLSQPFIFRRI